MTSMVTTFLTSFSPLRLRNFRRYLAGQAISQIGTWLQFTAQGWVAWQISHSTAVLGIIGMLATLPILLLGPWAGAWGDRLDRRKLLLGTQAIAMLLAFALAILTQTGAIQLWHLYLLSALLGIVNALDLPTQQAFVGDLAGMSELRKAIFLNTMITTLSRMLGPALAGAIIGGWGAATAFWLNGLSFLAVIVSLLIVQSSQIRKTGAANPLSEFAEGLRFIGSQPRMLDLIVFGIIITFFGLPIVNILPSVATDVLHGQAQVLGWLTAASGAGALVGSLIVAFIVQIRRKVGFVLGAAVVWMGLWASVLSQSNWLPLSMLCLFLLSLAAPVVFTTANGLLQTLSPANMRGRVVGVFLMLTFGLQPFAALFIGFSADRLSTPSAILVNGLLLVTTSILILILRPALRQWDANTHTAGNAQAA